MKSGFVAFLLWLPGLVGLAGLHRFYVGRYGLGIVWLLTFGLLGFGTLFDLFFLGSMVRSANLIAGLHANKATAVANANSVINVTVHAPPGYVPAPVAPTTPALEVTPQPARIEGGQTIPLSSVTNKSNV